VQVKIKKFTTFVVLYVQKYTACLIDRFTNRMYTNFTYSSQNVPNYITPKWSHKWNLQCYIYL